MVKIAMVLIVELAVEVVHESQSRIISTPLMMFFQSFQNFFIVRRPNSVYGFIFASLKEQKLCDIATKIHG